MCDYGRLNYKYLEAEGRLLEPQIRSEGRLVPADWPTAIGQAALHLKQFAGSEIAIVASGRMTNEELWLTAQLVNSLGVKWIDIVPRRGRADKILLSKDRNPNTNGARLILGSRSAPGAKLMAIANAVRSGEIKALVILKENAMHLGLSVEELAQMPALVVMNTLPNAATKNASVVLPRRVAEKRGSCHGMRFCRKTWLNGQRQGPLATVESRDSPAWAMLAMIGRFYATFFRQSAAATRFIRLKMFSAG